LQAHQKDIESGEKSAKDIAANLDKDLVKIKEQVRAIATKILNSGMVSPKLKSTLLQGLSVLEDEITRKIEDAKKTIEAKPDL
jgi:hypothetical protein